MRGPSTFRRTGKGGLRRPSTGVGLRPEHIPAFLPQAPADHHLGFLSAIAPKMRRRSASVFLVRRARGGSLDEAAQFLGINPQGKRNGYTQLLHRHLRTSGTARDFGRSLDAISAVWLREPHNVFHWLRTTDYQPYCGAIKALPEDHARLLAKAIDRTGSSTLPVPAARRR
ncbi:hypothetical protein [Actinacidiphila sp. ITFR-21]|uniref:hypothetical protein n=1 Tax=Actinacidiphila sp. ITFR-21 TaxID=3075199 RepID=UPI00288B38A1|nr:hypothetical protein [Streptomyces sp. ITFR-21]WNI19468.1 hypothetical protein RLT57_30590 [Streptomyces sp. ITFR-21]